jgi:hypothetical protein
VDPQVFAGAYEDGAGVEAIVWRIAGSGRYEITTTIRGVPVRGFDLDILVPEDEQDPRTAALPLTSAGELHDCVLSGDLPSAALVAGQQREVTVQFVLDLRPDPRRSPRHPRNLHLSVTIDDATFGIAHDGFEDGLLRLQETLPPQVRLMCCVTCLFSDYSPAGQGLMGMLCHRDAKEQYLAVRSKDDYFDVPVTEAVPETYLCPEYLPRIAGTGYRG